MSMKKNKFLASALSATVATSAIVSFAPAGFAAQAGLAFSDVKATDHFYEAINSLSSRSILKGYEDGTFRPYEKLTRAQAAKIIALTLKLDTDKVTNPGFKDVPTGSWEYGYVAALANKGIIKGYGSQFKPNEPLSRAQMAKVLALAFNIKPENANNPHFTDVKAGDWYAGYLKPLVEKGITTGTSSTTFSPNNAVTRGQMASFIFRSEMAVKPTAPTQIQAIIQDITSEEVVTDEGSFKISGDVTTWLNAKNLSVLKGAVIDFKVKDKSVEKINAIELTMDGKVSLEADKPYANHLVFDGKGAVIDTNVIVNGDYLTLKNLTIKGNLQIGKGVENSFYSDNLKVQGKTTVSETEVKAQNSPSKFYKSLAYKMYTASFNKAAETKAAGKASVVFNNSQLGTFEVATNDANVESKGSSTIQSVTLSGNVTFTAANTVTIPKIVISEGVTNVVVNSNVQEIVVVGNQFVTIAGTGNFGMVTASIVSTVSVETTGNVGTLVTADKESKFILRNGTKVGNLDLAEGTKPQDAIQNYDSVKGNIEQVDGQKNPDAAPSNPSTGGSSGGSSRANGPILSADTTDANVGNDIDLTFTDNANWRNNISSVTVDGRVLSADEYIKADSGKITIKNSVFTSVKDYSIVVKANGYYDVTITQAVNDGINPNIDHTAVTSGTEGQAININAEVTDNVAVDSVKLYYRAVGATAYTEVAMEKGTDNAYSVDIPGTAVTVSGIEYYIEAKDSSGNKASKGTESVPNAITVDDATDPVLTHTAVTSGTEGQAITIIAETTDNVAVDSVKLYYRTTNGTTYTEVSMEKGVDNAYSVDIPGTAVTVSGIEYYIEAKDSSGNKSSKGTESVPNAITVGDATDPVLTHTAVTSGTEGQAINIIAEAIDNVTVDSVKLYYRTTNGTTYTDVSMEKDVDNTFKANIPETAVTVPGIEYYIEAEDSSGNKAFKGTESAPNVVTVTPEQN